MFNSVRILPIFPHFLLIYIVLYAITGYGALCFIFTIGLLVTLFFYKLPQANIVDSDEVLEIGRIPIIAHRGAAKDAPENTLAAIRLAKQNGATAIEFDVLCTSDGIPVVIHDDTVDRTTDGMGLVTQMSLASIQQLNASVKHPQSNVFPNERIPTLEDVIRLCLDLGLKMYIDVKDPKQSPDKICEMFQKFPQLYKNAAVCSFHPNVIYMVKKLDKQIVTGLTHCPNIASMDCHGNLRKSTLWERLLLPVFDVLLEWAQYGWLWYLCGNSAFLMSRTEINESLIHRFKKLGIHVVVWTVNNKSEKRYLENVLKVAYMTDTLLA